MKDSINSEILISIPEDLSPYPQIKRAANPGICVDYNRSVKIANKFIQKMNLRAKENAS